MWLFVTETVLTWRPEQTHHTIRGSGFAMKVKYAPYSLLNKIEYKLDSTCAWILCSQILLVKY